MVVLSLLLTRRGCVLVCLWSLLLFTQDPCSLKISHCYFVTSFRLHFIMADDNPAPPKRQHLVHELNNDPLLAQEVYALFMQQMQQLLQQPPNPMPYNQRLPMPPSASSPPSTADDSASVIPGSLESGAGQPTPKRLASTSTWNGGLC